MWLKPKFAKKVEYVFSIDIIKNAKSQNSLIDSILNDKGFESQIKEWQELNLINESFNKEDFIDFCYSCHIEETQITTKESKNNKYSYLPIDTKHFECETKYKILNAFEDLESILNGELIKADNFQALNSLMPKYQGKVDLIYIDPPYNAPASEIIYKNNFKDSTWLSMMENRLRLGKEFLSQRGILTCAIDENEQENLGLLLSDIFYEYEKTCVSVVHNPSGTQGDNFSYSNEFAYFMYPNIKNIIQGVARDEKDVRNFRDVTGSESLRTAAKNCFYPIYVKDSKIVGFGEVCKDDFHPTANVTREDGIIEVYPIDPQGIERKWRFARQTIENIKKTYQINVFSVFLLIRECVKYMKASNQGCKILNVASTAGITPRPGWLSYASSKAAIVSMSQTLAEELAEYRIKVYCISPGRCATALRRKLAPSEDQSQIMQPEEVGEIITQLISQNEHCLDGQNIVIRKK